ncbi:MAG: hypothetical protein ACRDT4_11780 [Micromonosporaceae bacterium]
MSSLPGPVRPLRSLTVIVGVVVALFGGLALAGCSSGGSNVSCTLDSCTVTLDRGVDAKTEVLGVEVKLVKVEGENVTLEVAGTEVTTQVGRPVDVEGFQVEVQEVTEKNVKVKISKSS